MIKIAFFWHQHQPYYKNSLTGEYSMPWVRLHGIRDYIGMAMILEEFPRIRQTINYVPCLLDQIKDYAENRGNDSFWTVTKIPAGDLTEDNKLYVLDNFFTANQHTMIEIYPRYMELFTKRNLRRKRAHDVLKEFSPGDFQDLQVWANLAWYHPLVLQKDEGLAELVRKGSGFTLQDKEYVLSKQVEVMRQIIPLHKKLQDARQIEVTTSPYYHPILPLLCNQESARAALPKLPLPKKRLQAHADAKVQVERAVQTYEKHFGQKPRGMWPSEGAVSNDVVPILAQAGFQWVASDEEILACSTVGQITRDNFGDVAVPDVLYKPYRVRTFDNAVNMVFRDHNISDLIGFQYSRYHTDAAVSDFIQRIHRLKRHSSSRPLLVTIILDGENAWEYYPNSGLDFLRKLYGTIDSDPDLECVRICDYLEEYVPEQTLHHLCPGSWIGHNLATWIGHEEKNMAWDFIESTRSFLVNQSEGAPPLPSEALSRAWEEIYIAEGSDWFWWFGDDHFTHYKDEFDHLFRQHLKNVYKLFNVDNPRILDVPISARSDRRKPYSLPKRFLEVKLDGLVSNYFEWLDAGEYNPDKDMGAMHAVSSQPVTGVHFGFNRDNLFLRVDFHRDAMAQYREKGKLIVTFVHPHELQINTSLFVDKPFRFTLHANSREPQGKVFSSIILGKILELSCPFADLGFTSGMEVEFFIELARGDENIQRIPLHTVFCFTVPSADFDEMMWQV